MNALIWAGRLFLTAMGVYLIRTSFGAAEVIGWVLLAVAWTTWSPKE